MINMISLNEIKLNYHDNALPVARSFKIFLQPEDNSFWSYIENSVAIAISCMHSVTPLELGPNFACTFC